MEARDPSPSPNRVTTVLKPPTRSLSRDRDRGRERERDRATPSCRSSSTARQAVGD